MRDTAKEAKTRFDELSKKVPKITIHPPAKADELSVKMDDKPVPKDKLGGEIWTNPGQHRIVASGKIGDESLSFERDVSVEEGGSVSVDIKLVPEGATVTDNRVLKCLEESKSRDELAKCIGEGSGSNINVKLGVEVSGYMDNDHTAVI